MASARFSAAVRQFSTSAVRTNLVQAPIQVFGLEGRYAHALFSAASKGKKLDQVEKDLVSIQGMLTKNPKLAEFIANPAVKRIEKKSVLTQVLEEQKYDPLTINLFGAMAENGRLNKLNSILGAYVKIMSAVRGEVVCSVTTAKALDAASLKELKAALQSFLKKGETLQLETKIDPAIIGGMVVNIGDKYVDMSMSTKIKTYTNLIKEGI